MSESPDICRLHGYSTRCVNVRISYGTRMVHASLINAVSITYHMSCGYKVSCGTAGFTPVVCRAGDDSAAGQNGSGQDQTMPEAAGRLKPSMRRQGFASLIGTSSCRRKLLKNKESYGISLCLILREDFLTVMHDFMRHTCNVR